MIKAITRAALVAAGVSGALALSAVPAAAQAPANAELAQIHDEIAALRADSAAKDAKIAALEARLAAAEAAGASAPSPAPDIALITPSEPAPTPVASQPNAMNPGVSVVLNGNYFASSRDPSAARIPGYALGDEAGLPQRGPSLGESEITLAANVDPFLKANLTVSFDGDNQLSVEEAFVQSTSLPAGLTFKAGRFFSAVGYLNESHAHNWAFIDMPLPYRALLGNQYGDDGLQVRWLAPAPFFLEFGAEAYAGQSFPAARGGANNPGVATAFVHSGGDISDSSSWLAALSYLHSDANGRVTGTDVFDGSDGLTIASLVYKWAPGGNPYQRSLVLSGEYFLDRQDGTFNSIPINRNVQGWYAQGVYHFGSRWNAGLRYSRLDSPTVPLSLVGSTLDGLGHAPNEVSGLLEFDTSEFGRFRVQLTHDLAEAQANNELRFQYTVIFGPHGAHRY